MRNRRAFLRSSVVAALIIVGGNLSIAGAMSAAPPAGISLAFFSGGLGANAHWSTVDPVGGTPTDVSRVIVFNNPLTTGSTYSGATVNGVSGLSMSDVTQLSFMIDTGAYMGAGAPRFSVILSDGVTLFPSAGDCPLSANTGWQTAIFVGPESCTIYGSESPGTTSGSATWSEWSSFLGDPTIVSMFIVQDEGPAQAYLANVSVNNHIAA